MSPTPRWGVRRHRSHAAWGNIYFYINGTQVAVLTSNIPANTSIIPPRFSIYKPAGTTAYNLYVDYWYHKYQYQRAPGLGTGLGVSGYWDPSQGLFHYDDFETVANASSSIW